MYTFLKNKKYILVSLLIGLQLFVAPAPVAMAACPNGTAETTFNFDTNKDGCTDFQDLVVTIFRFLSALVGLLAIGGVIAGGIMWSTSQGNPANTAKGAKIIGNTLMGVALYFLLVAIANFLVPGGIL